MASWTSDELAEIDRAEELETRVAATGRHVAQPGDDVGRAGR